MPLGSDGLGRGLQDVLAKTIRRDPPRGYLEVDLGLIVPPKANPRKTFDQDSIDELSASVAQHGVMQPIIVVRRDVGYEIISGERRYRAAKQAGLAKVPVVVREDDNPQHVAELRLIENIQREDLNPLDLAEAYQRLLTDHGLTHDDLAARLNKNRSGITNTLRLLSLPEPIREQLRRGALSLGHAKGLLSCHDSEWQLTLANRAEHEGLSVREVERLAKAKAAAPVATPSTSHASPPHIRELEENLRLLFGTKVRLVEKANGKGTMTVHFSSRDQFQRLIAVMAKVMEPSRKS